MTKGKFEGLFTFQDVSMIYGLDISTVRKSVKRSNLVENEEYKKFGTTWMITNKAMLKHFGKDMFNTKIYLDKIK